MNIVLTISPIFLVVLLGIFARRWDFLPQEFVGPANRLAMNLAIPALLFRAVYKAPMDLSLQLAPILAGMGVIIATSLAAVFVSRFLLDPAGERPGTRATWIQCTYHGNLGFMGLATVFYSQGQAGLAVAGLLVAFMNLTHNLISVLVLSRLGSKAGSKGSSWRGFLANPIILSTAGGILAGALGLPLPQFLDRTLSILAGMGLPLALLIIGATLDLGNIRVAWRPLAGLTAFKLFLMPAAGLGLMLLLGQAGLAAAAVVVLLAQPCGTLVAVMAGEMGGDGQLGAAAVSLTTALSLFTLTLWLFIVHAL